MKKFAIACVGMLLFAANAYAQDTVMGDEDYVVANVNGKDIMYSEVKLVYESLPQLQAMPLDSIFDKILDDVINTEVIASAAKEAGVESSPDFQREFEMIKRRLIAAHYLKTKVESEASEEKLRRLYAVFNKENPPADEVRARHILVQTEEEAKAIIEKLKKGADFTDIANEVSEDKGANDGGDLGWFTKDTMVAEFSEEAFKLKKGQFSQKPVQTQFGWHIVKVEDKRKAKPLEFEQVEERLKSQFVMQEAEKMIDSLKRKAKVKNYGIAGKKST